MKYILRPPQHCRQPGERDKQQKTLPLLHLVPMIVFCKSSIEFYFYKSFKFNISFFKRMSSLKTSTKVREFFYYVKQGNFQIRKI